MNLKEIDHVTRAAELACNEAGKEVVRIAREHSTLLVIERAGETIQINPWTFEDATAEEIALGEQRYIKEMRRRGHDI